VERLDFEEVNRHITEQGGKPAEGEPVPRSERGITKASLETDSFISAPC
jgi:DNA-directed RNA polymerase subunit beta'